MKPKGQTKIQSSSGPRTRSRTKLGGAIKKVSVKKARKCIILDQRPKSGGFKPEEMAELPRTAELIKCRSVVSNSSKTTALRNHRAEMATISIRAGANVNGCPSALLERAVVAGKRVLVETLLDYASVEKNLDVHPLFLAAGRSDSSIAKLLIKKGSSVHACNALGQTSLFAACRSGSYACIDLLLQLGVDVNKVDDKGHVAYYYLEHKFENLTCRKLFVLHAALLVSRGAAVHSENLALIEACPVTRIFYKACAIELEKTKSATISENITLHSVLTMGISRLSSLMRAAKFDKKLKSRMSRISTYRLYCEQLRKTVNIAEKRRGITVTKIEALSEIFNEILPLLVIEKIADYSCYEKLFNLRIYSI